MSPRDRRHFRSSIKGTVISEMCGAHCVDFRFAVIALYEGFLTRTVSEYIPDHIERFREAVCILVYIAICI